MVLPTALCRSPLFASIYLSHVLASSSYSFPLSASACSILLASSSHSFLLPSSSCPPAPSTRCFLARCAPHDLLPPRYSGTSSTRGGSGRCESCADEKGDGAGVAGGEEVDRRGVGDNKAAGDGGSPSPSSSFASLLGPSFSLLSPRLLRHPSRSGMVSAFSYVLGLLCARPLA